MCCRQGHSQPTGRQPRDQKPQLSPSPLYPLPVPDGQGKAKSRSLWCSLQKSAEGGAKLGVGEVGSGPGGTAFLPRPHSATSTSAWSETLPHGSQPRGAQAQRMSPGEEATNGVSLRREQGVTSEEEEVPVERARVKDYGD